MIAVYYQTYAATTVSFMTSTDLTFFVASLDFLALDFAP